MRNMEDVFCALLPCKLVGPGISPENPVSVATKHMRVSITRWILSEVI